MTYIILLDSCLPGGRQKNYAVLQVSKYLLHINFGDADFDLEESKRKEAIIISTFFSSLPGPRSSEFINDIPTYLFGISFVYDYRYDGNMSLCTVERCIIVIIIVNRDETAILIPTKIPRHRVWSRTRRRPMTISERSVTGKRASRWVRKIYTRDVDPHRRRLQCRGVYFIIYAFFPLPHDLHNTCSAMDRRALSAA